MEETVVVRVENPRQPYQDRWFVEDPADGPTSRDKLDIHLT